MEWASGNISGLIQVVLSSKLKRAVCKMGVVQLSIAGPCPQSLPRVGTCNLRFDYNLYTDGGYLDCFVPQ